MPISPSVTVIALIICFLLLDIFVVNRLQTKRAQRFRRTKWRFVVYCIAIIIIYATNFQRIHFGARPSPVDVSPIARLTAEQIGRLGAALDSLLDSYQAHEYIWSFRRNEGHGIPHDTWEASYFMIFGYPQRFEHTVPIVRVMISIRFFRYEQYLIDTMPRSRSAYTLPGANAHILSGSTVIVNDNNTQAFMAASYVPRSHGFSINTRHIRTEIRLGNVFIDMVELRGSRYEIRCNLSSEFIQFLYELLTAEE